MIEPVLDIRDLSISYASEEGLIHALRHATVNAAAGEVVGVVGESGCGKSTLASATINLIAANGKIESGSVRLHGRDILSLPDNERRKIRGQHIAMIFQDPMTSFNPVLTLGEQLTDFQEHKADVSRTEKWKCAAAMLAQVGIPDPEYNLRRYVHELSGGMRQRAAIAAALLMTPDVLVADEPTTALDVTMEAQIIHLLRELRQNYSGAIVIITHHLGLIGELCDRVYVMYAGEVVEEGLTDEIYHASRHPYTQALIACDPATLEGSETFLPTIPGRLPDLVSPPEGCSFAARCPRAHELCHKQHPAMVRISSTHQALCHEAGR